MTMGPVEAGMEFGNLALGLMGVMQGRRNRNMHGTGGTVIAGKTMTEVLVEAIKSILKASGVGHYDEAEVSKLCYTGMNAEQRRHWTALMSKLNEDERKTLNLMVYLMERDTETHEIPAKKPDGSHDKDKPGTKVTKHVGDDPRLKFMTEICADVKHYSEGGADGAATVAQMLRDNEYIGASSAIKRYQAKLASVMQQIDDFIAHLEEGFDTPVPMNIFKRTIRLGMIGPRLIKPEPILQGDGIGNAIKRMAGMRTRRN